jgi:hypothetical protein
MLLDDAVRGGQAEAGSPFPISLVVRKGVEQSVTEFQRYARPVSEMVSSA